MTVTTDLSELTDAASWIAAGFPEHSAAVLAIAMAHGSRQTQRMAALAFDAHGDAVTLVGTIELVLATEPQSAA